jgi:hypothetical protein
MYTENNVKNLYSTAIQVNKWKSAVLLIYLPIHLFYTGTFHMPNEMMFQVKVVCEAATT